MYTNLTNNALDKEDKSQKEHFVTSSQKSAKGLDRSKAYKSQSQTRSEQKIICDSFIGVTSKRPIYAKRAKAWTS